MVKANKGGKKGSMACTKEELVKKINALQNQVSNPSPKDSIPSNLIQSDDETDGLEAKEDAVSTSTSTEVSSETLLDTILKKFNSLEENVKDLKKENASL